MSNILIFAEKPSQRRVYEEALSKTRGNNNLFYCNAVGHLLELKKPIKQKWSFDILPIIRNSNHFIDDYEVVPDKLKVIKEIKRSIESNKISEIVCATDSDNEGGAIYETVLSYIGKEVDLSNIKQTRLIPSDLTETTLQRAFDNRIDYSILRYQGIQGIARAKLDFTYGLSYTIGVTVKKGQLQTVGRVMSPTLRMICDRYEINKNTKSYIVKRVNYSTENTSLEFKNDKHTFENEVQAEDFIKARTYKVTTRVKNIKKSPPSLYDLASLQRWANKTLKISPDETLNLLQSLYEDKLISYPRTDCKNISESTAIDISKIFTGQIIKGIKLNDTINRSVIGKVSAHEGIVTTSKIYDYKGLSLKDRIYEEIRNTVIQNMLDSAAAKQIHQEMTISSNGEVYTYGRTFHVLDQEGFSALTEEQPFSNTLDYDVDEDISNIKELAYTVVVPNIKDKTISPPKLFTEGTLISAMENISNLIEDKELRKISNKNEGIGTPSTRSSIIKNLFEKKYVELEKNNIVPTKLGIELYEIYNMLSQIKLFDTSYTAAMEKEIEGIKTEQDLKSFLDDKINICKKEIELIKSSDIVKVEKPRDTIGKCPKCDEEVLDLNTKNGKFYPCENKECGYILPTPYRQNLTTTQAKLLLLGKQTTKEFKFTSRGGKDFTCYIKLNSDKTKIEFVF